MLSTADESPFMISLKALEARSQKLESEILTDLADMALSAFPDGPAKAKELYLSKARKKELFSERAIFSVWDSVFSAFDPDAISQ